MVWLNDFLNEQCGSCCCPGRCLPPAAAGAMWCLGKICNWQLFSNSAWTGLNFRNNFVMQHQVSLLGYNKAIIKKHMEKMAFTNLLEHPRMYRDCRSRLYSISQFPRVKEVVSQYLRTSAEDVWLDWLGGWVVCRWGNEGQSSYIRQGQPLVVNLSPTRRAMFLIRSEHLKWTHMDTDTDADEHK